MDFVETSAFSGFTINVRSLLSKHPKNWATIKRLYPIVGYTKENEDEYRDCWCLPGDEIFMEVLDFVEKEIDKDLSIDVTGSWYGHFIGECPFEKDEAYAVFDSDTKIREFMQQHNIPEEMLQHYEWQCKEY